jgi:eukaryotic-like serine/threonine-protein kinase
MAGMADQMIGPYRLVRRLGRGGFADVWLAERSGPGGFNRQVALKLVVAGDADGDDMRAESLLREARLVSWLDDPAIVAVEAAEAQDDFVWMAMEYCDGGSLTSLLRRLTKHKLPMPPAVAVRIVRDVARALSAAHHLVDPDGRELCVVHRDLKPGNVLLTRSGDTKVCDFGIAKATDETNVTGTGMLKGTASYVAPELWSDVRAFSPASDAFALGTLLVELITMERLHAGGAMPMVFRRITEGTGAEDAARVAPYLPDAVPLLVDLLERDPKARLADMTVAALRLDALLDTLPPPANPGLLLEVLEHLDGRARAPKLLPEQVGHAWQVVLWEALGVDVPLVPGPGGADEAWELAFREATDQSGSKSVAHGLAMRPIEELSLDGSTVLPNAPLGGEPTVAPAAALQGESTQAWSGAASAASGLGSQATVEVGPLVDPPPVATPSSPELPADPPRTTSGEQTMDRRRSPGARRRRRPPKKTSRITLGVLMVAVLALVGILFVQIASMSDGTSPVVSAPAPSDGASSVDSAPAAAVPKDEPASDPAAADARVADPSADPLTDPSIDAPEPRVSAAPEPSSDAPSSQEKPPAPAPDVRPQVEPEPPAAPEPSPQSPPAPVEVAAAPAAPCLVVTSRPAGAFLWVDERVRPLRVRSKPGPAGTVSPGSHRVSMSLVEGEPQAHVVATLRAGAGTLVHCDLLGSPTCRASSADAALCVP